MALTEEQNNVVKGVLKDFAKWSDKVNAMMIEGARGETPQYVNMLLLKQSVDGYFDSIEADTDWTAKNSKKAKEMFEMMKGVMNMKSRATTSIKEAEDKVYGKREDLNG